MPSLVKGIPVHAANPQPSPAPGLTPRQDEVLLHCVKRGYYAIPRRATLRMLGEDLGITAVSLSLLLRRAEGKVVVSYTKGLANPTATQRPA